MRIIGGSVFQVVLKYNIAELIQQDGVDFPSENYVAPRRLDTVDFILVSILHKAVYERIASAEAVVFYKHVFTPVILPVSSKETVYNGFFRFRRKKTAHIFQGKILFKIASVIGMYPVL